MSIVVPGAYHLLIRLRRAKAIRVGVLGTCRFQPGWYVYTGSARNGLAQRVRRHLRHDKRMHWHIDYLLEVANQIEVFVLPGTELPECELHDQIGGQILVPGFGSSDCRCVSHLAYFRQRPKIMLRTWATFTREHGVSGESAEGL